MNADGTPTKLGLPLGDVGGGLWAALGVMAAVAMAMVNTAYQVLMAPRRDASSTVSGNTSRETGIRSACMSARWLEDRLPGGYRQS